MVWLITMIAGVFGIYAKGHQWAGKKNANPVLTAVTSLSENVEELAKTIADYGSELKDVAARVTALEQKDDVDIRG